MKTTTNSEAKMNWQEDHERKMRQYREEVRETFRQMSDEALRFQDARVIGGIDREELDREIRSRSPLSPAVTGWAYDEI